MKLHFLALSFIFLCSTGCSVFLAATPSGDPDMGILKVGALRGDIEAQLGRPTSFKRKSNGDEAVYRFVSGDRENYKRAAAYAIADIMTLGISEIVSSPLEELQGNPNIVTVIYSPRGRVVSFFHEKQEAPLAPPEEILAKASN